MDSDNQVLSCDVCGRLVRGALDDERLSYCSGCQRFVCGICWVPGRDICRVCLHPGQVVAPRLRPVINETFVPSTSVQPRPVRLSAGLPPPVGDGRQPPVAPAARHRWLRPAFVGVAAVATLAVGVGFATSLGRDDSIGVDQGAPASREAVLAGGGSTAPSSVPTAAASTAPSSVPTAAAPTSGRYTVQPGDTMRGIAGTVYGDELQWRRIHVANRAAVPDANRLSVGQVLAIPRP